MSNILDFPILSLLCFFPLVGALLVIFFFDKTNTKAIKYFTLYISIVEFIFSLLLIVYFNWDTHEMQFVEKISWIGGLGVDYFMGIDGISILLVVLTTFIQIAAVACSFTAITERQKEYYALLMILETGMLGVFFAMDFFLFYVLWEVMLIPMYFIIGIWGGPRKLYAAIKFFLYTFFGSVIMLLGILALYYLNQNPEYGSGQATFNVLTMMKMRLPFIYQFWIFMAFFLGFAIKVPMFPFHTWLPDAHTEAPTAGSVILAGVLLKMGTYGFLRFSLPILPEATQKLVPFMAILAIIGIIYGAIVAFPQRDIKKLVAYSSVSHLGYVVLGIFSLNREGIAGSILQMINHGLSTGALFLIVGIIYERRHTRLISEYGGISKLVPKFTTIFIIVMLSSIGVPLLNGFVGELFIIIGATKVSYYYGFFAGLGLLFGAAYLLWLFQRVMLGKMTNQENKHLTDCNSREMAYMVPIVILMFWIGIYPKPFIRIMEPSIKHLVEQVSPIKEVTKVVVSK